MALLATMLSAARSASGRGLKVVEAAAFGLAACVVAVHLWAALLSGTARSDATALKAAAKDAINGTTIVLFTYALLIPAPTGRAWRSIAAIAACPIATEMILFLVHPGVFRLARRVATLQSVGETVFFLLTVALLAGYGAYLANTMRVRRARPANSTSIASGTGSGAGGWERSTSPSIGC